MYLWKFLPHRDFDEYEEKDLQICICLGAYKKLINVLKNNEHYESPLVEKQKDAPLDLAYKVDDFDHECFSYKKILFKKVAVLKHTEIESSKETLYVKFSQDFIQKLEDCNAYAQKSPFVLYSFVWTVDIFFA